MEAALGRMLLTDSKYDADQTAESSSAARATSSSSSSFGCYYYYYYYPYYYPYYPYYYPYYHRWCASPLSPLPTGRRADIP